ncbi:hypothetical protein B0H13DRAFT_2525183, partial [Mycena leptocephala]
EERIESHISRSSLKHLLVFRCPKSLYKLLQPSLLPWSANLRGLTIANSPWNHQLVAATANTLEYLSIMCLDQYSTCTVTRILLNLTPFTMLGPSQQFALPRMQSLLSLEISFGPGHCSFLHPWFVTTMVGLPPVLPALEMLVINIIFHCTLEWALLEKMRSCSRSVRFASRPSVVNHASAGTWCSSGHSRPLPITRTPYRSAKERR